MGPLSGKQHREYLKFAAKERREDVKAELEESRKQELHEIKLQEAAQKANQALVHKEDTHAAKMEELGGPLSKRSKIKVEPIAVPPVNNGIAPSDTVPAMLTPGEAVIPAPAAQDPKNKPIIKQMVEEGRQGYATGTIKVKDNLPSIPIVGPKRRGVKGYADGTEEVDPYDVRFSRMPVIGIPSTNNEIIPNPAFMGKVPTEAAMRQAVKNTPADDAFYANIKENPERDKAEIIKELAKAKPGSIPHQVLTAELAKYNGIIPQVQKSPWGETGGGAATGNPIITRKAATAVTKIPTPSNVSSGKVVDMIPPLPPTGAGAGRGNSQAGDPEEIAKINEQVTAVVGPPTPMDADKAIADFSYANRQYITDKVTAINNLDKPAEVKKTMMESFLSDLYGDKGIFNRKDLVRFAAVAAGGLITGGSINGSLRYAARDTLANSDKRHAAEAVMADRRETAIDAELRAERTKFETLNASVRIPPTAKKEIEKLLSFKPDATPAEKVEAVRKANILLGQHAALADKATPMPIESGYINGKPIEYREDKLTGKRYTRDNDGNWVVTNKSIVPSVEYDRQTTNLTNDIVPRIEAKLHKENDMKGGKESVASISARAKNTALIFRTLKEEIGDVNTNAFSKVVEDTLAHTGADNLSEEGLRKAFYGNAVVRLRPTVASKYYMAKNDGKSVPPSAEALSIYGNKLQEYVKQGLPLEKAAEKLENAFDDYKKKNPDKAKLLENTTNTGFSPFLQWVRNGS